MEECLMKYALYHIINNSNDKKAVAKMDETVLYKFVQASNRHDANSVMKETAIHHKQLSGPVAVTKPRSAVAMKIDKEKQHGRLNTN